MKNRRFIFSEDDKKYIIENWGKESAHSMKKKFGCSWYAVVGIAKENGLELPTSNDWTDEQIETLKTLAEQYHYEDIAEKMGKTGNAIYIKANRLGIILIQDRRKWTKKEEEDLKDLWGNKRVDLVASDLKRSVFSIRVKAIRMGLGSMILNNFEKITISDISELLDTSRDRITRTWAELGLKITHTKLTCKQSYMTVTWSNLMLFLENNQNEWDSRKIEKNMLGPEPDWLTEKRFRDIKEPPLWYRKWTIEEIKRAENLLKIGKDYQFIALEINRSEGVVTKLLENMAYRYKLSESCKERELQYVKKYTKM